VSELRSLTGRGAAPVRQFFWHFPLYTNQGSRPSGAVRDGSGYGRVLHGKRPHSMTPQGNRETQDLASHSPSA
jgi:hypothetical protein